jgi:hypothetical protein
MVMDSIECHILGEGTWFGISTCVHFKEPEEI